MESATIALAAPEPDWNSIQERYLAGDEINAIAEDNGTTANAIRIRACRNRWKDQQLKLVEKSKLQIGEEIKGCLLVSCLREARLFQRSDPAFDPDSLDTLSRVRLRLLETTSKLLGWSDDPLASAKRVQSLDV